MTQNVNELWQNAIAHHHSGRLIEAQQLYLQILKQQPECVAAFHNLGMIACQSEQFAIAITYYKQALEIAPNRVDAYWKLCDILSQTNNFPYGGKQQSNTCYIAAVLILSGIAQILLGQQSL